MPAALLEDVFSTFYPELALIEINHIIGCLSAELSLYERGMNNVSLATLKKLSTFLKESYLDFDRGARSAMRDKATEVFLL